MPVTDQGIVNYARELWPWLTVEGAPDGTLLAWVPVCRARVDQNVFSTKLFGGSIYSLYDAAVAHLLAHQMLMVDPTGEWGDGGWASGPLTSRSTLSMSEGFGSAPGATGSFKDSDLVLTKPGLAFLALLRTRPRAVMPRYIRGR